MLAGDAGFFAVEDGGHAGDAALVLVDGRDLGLLDDFRAEHARALGHGVGNVGRIALAVFLDPDCSLHVADLEMRVALLSFLRRNLPDLDAAGAAHGGGAQQLFLAVFRQRHGNRAELAHAGGDTRLFFQPAVEVGGVFRQPGHVGAGAQLADQAGRMPGGAAGELLAFEQQYVGPAELGQVIGDRAAGDAAADDDDAGL